MFEWWNSLGITMQVFYCIALPATLIIVIQTILLMIGIGHGGEGVEFSDTSGIDGLDVPDMPADVPADIPTDMPGAHAIDGCEHTAIGDGSNPADFGTMQLFTLQGIMTFLCIRLAGYYMYLARTSRCDSYNNCACAGIPCDARSCKGASAYKEAHSGRKP